MCCYPWRSVLCLEKRHWPGVLEHMREEWKFILFLDGFSSTSQARRLFTFTEMQCFRELFTEAEPLNCSLSISDIVFFFSACSVRDQSSIQSNPIRSIDFDASHVDSERVRALAERLAGSDTKALLSSLPNELMFNDLRDAQRRHAKHEMAKPVHLAAVSIRSSGHRSPLHAVEVDNADWNSHDQAKVLRSNILQAARERDKHLGVPLQELICEKNLSYVTKPHIYCQRLRLFQNLKRKFFAGDGHAIDVDKILREVWPSNTLTPGCLWQQESFNNEAVVVVLSGGPHAVRYMQLKLVEVPGYDELYGFDDGKLQVHETLDFHMCFGKLSYAAAGGIGGAWLTGETSGMVFPWRVHVPSHHQPGASRCVDGVWQHFEIEPRQSQPEKPCGADHAPSPDARGPDQRHPRQYSG